MNIDENVRIHKMKFNFVDFHVLTASLILCSIGILMVFSITGTYIFNNRMGDRLGYMTHSITGFFLGLALMALATIFPNKWFRGRFGLAIVIFTLGLLILTPLVGIDVPSSPGVYRWIRIPGVITFQAVDLARIGFTISVPWIVKHLIEKKIFYTKKIWSYYVVPLFFVVICAGLIIAQPDLGSAIVIAITGFIIFFSSGIHKIQIYFLVFVGIGFLVFGLIFGHTVLLGYQANRIAAWLDPFSHPFGLQTTMGFVSIALGGWTGVGIGNSSQTLGFAIEAHTDMIITIVSEELGVLWVLAIMGLYLLIATKCFLTALKSTDEFNALVCIGVGSFFLAQPFVNLAGVIGLIPLSGITLPFISHGMTSMVSTFVLIGLYFNMRRQILVDHEKEKIIRNRENNKQTANGNASKIIPFKTVG